MHTCAARGRGAPPPKTQQEQRSTKKEEAFYKKRRLFRAAAFDMQPVALPNVLSLAWSWTLVPAYLAHGFALARLARMLPVHVEPAAVGRLRPAAHQGRQPRGQPLRFGGLRLHVLLQHKRQSQTCCHAFEGCLHKCLDKRNAKRYFSKPLAWKFLSPLPHALTSSSTASPSGTSSHSSPPSPFSVTEVGHHSAKQSKLGQQVTSVSQLVVSKHLQK